MPGPMRRTGAGLAWLAVGALLMVIVGNEQVGAGPNAANKAAAAGSTTMVAAPNETVTLLAKQVKTSAPMDLVLHVTAECSIVTDVTTVFDDEQEAIGHIEVWVEIDGRPVLVGPDDGDGRVVFCRRAYKRMTQGFGDDDERADTTIGTFFSTRSAHAFNWVKTNVGSGTHSVRVKAALRTAATTRATAEAVVGKRTLVIEPAKMSNDADLLSG